MSHAIRISHVFPGLVVALTAGLLAGPAVAQDWSADVLDTSTVDRDSTGAVVPAADLQEAEGQPQNLPLFKMTGTQNPPPGSMAQHYVFVRNGETVADWPAEANGRIGLVSSPTRGCRTRSSRRSPTTARGTTFPVGTNTFEPTIGADGDGNLFYSVTSGSGVVIGFQAGSYIVPGRSTWTASRS